MANKKNTKKQEEETSADIEVVHEEQEEVLDPVAESRELELDQRSIMSNDFVEPQEEAEHIILTRENLILIGPGLFKYTHDESNLSAVQSATAFKGQMARNFGIRPGDAVICGPVEGGEGMIIYVPKDEK